MSQSTGIRVGKEKSENCLQEAKSTPCLYEEVNLRESLRFMAFDP